MNDCRTVLASSTSRATQIYKNPLRQWNQEFNDCKPADFGIVTHKKVNCDLILFARPSRKKGAKKATHSFCSAVGLSGEVPALYELGN